MIWAGLIAVALIALFAARAGEVFCLSFRRGKLLRVRGQVPQALMNDFADTLRRANVPKATLKAHRTADGLRLTASGVCEWDLQRLRNQLGHHGWSRLRSHEAQEKQKRSLVGWLGFAWLAWLLARPDELL
jgi:hypothetical protein